MVDIHVCGIVMLHKVCELCSYHVDGSI